MWCPVGGVKVFDWLVGPLDQRVLVTVRVSALRCSVCGAPSHEPDVQGDAAVGSARIVVSADRNWCAHGQSVGRGAPRISDSG